MQTIMVRGWVGIEARVTLHITSKIRCTAYQRHPPSTATTPLSTPSPSKYRQAKLSAPNIKEQLKTVPQWIPCHRTQIEGRPFRLSFHSCVDHLNPMHIADREEQTLSSLTSSQTSPVSYHRLTSPHSSSLSLTLSLWYSLPV